MTFFDYSNYKAILFYNITFSQVLRYAYVTVNLSNSFGLIHSGKIPVSIRNSRFVWVC